MEEGKIYDFEDDWKPCNSGRDKVIVFVNDKYPSLFRVIDIDAGKITFSDVNRIDKVVDINKVLIGASDSDELKRRFLPLLNKMLDTIEPISMPYEPNKYTAYIENFVGFDKNYEDTLGILYFKLEKGDDSEMIACKKFFRIMPVGASSKYEEITYEAYMKAKEGANVD